MVGSVSGPGGIPSDYGGSSDPTAQQLQTITNTFNTDYLSLISGGMSSKQFISAISPLCTDIAELSHKAPISGHSTLQEQVVAGGNAMTNAVMAAYKGDPSETTANFAGTAYAALNNAAHQINPNYPGVRPGAIIQGEIVAWNKSLSTELQNFVDGKITGHDLQTYLENVNSFVGLCLHEGEAKLGGSVYAALNNLQTDIKSYSNALGTNQASNAELVYYATCCSRDLDSAAQFAVSH